MEGYFSDRLSRLEREYAGTPSIRTREQQLEEENKALKAQLAQQQNIDPMLAEFYRTPEYQGAKKDNFLTFLFSHSYPQWADSQLGQEFAKWEKEAFEEYKKRKMATVRPAPSPQSAQQSTTNYAPAYPASQ